MPTTHKVKKVAVETNDIAGLKSSRYEKLQVSYGVIPSTGYSLGDTLVFSDVPSKDIIRATVVAHATVPVTLEVYPGAANNGTFSLLLSSLQSGTCKLSYIIEYVRGTGRVGSSSTDNSGEGELFSVLVDKGSTSISATKEEIIGDDV
jgi:hypothetical protein